MKGWGGRWGRAWLALPVVCGLGSCASGDGTTPSVEVVSDTVDGVERLTYSAAAGPQLSWTVDTVAVIGAAFGEGAYQLGEVWPGGLGGDAEGNVYVLDRMANVVHEYGPDGGHRGSYGRKGQGPGEIQTGIHLRIGPGDTVWVADFGNNRLTGFSREDATSRSISLPQGIWPRHGLSLGRDAIVMGTLTLPGTGTPAEQGPTPISLVRLDYGGVILDTVWTAPPKPTDEIVVEIDGQTMVAFADREFAPSLHLGRFSDGSLAVADAAEYRVAILSPDGALSSWLRRAPAPQRTTDVHRDAAREAVRRREARSPRANLPGHAQFTEARIDRMTFAEEIPRIVRLAVDFRDRLWIGVSEDTPGEVERIDVYTSAGTLIGEVRGVPFPDAFSGDDRLEVLERDELDVQRVLVLRLN